MDITYFILRLVHVLTTVIWAGFAVMLTLFILPAVSSMGPDGGKFMAAFGKTRNFPVFMSILTGIAVLSGILLYIKISVPQMMGTKFGIMLSIGATTGLIAFFIGSFVNSPSVKKMNKIAAEIAKSGGTPTAEQMQSISGLRNKLVMGTRWIAILMVISVIAMSMSKYI